jgi:hypothetical protein
MMRRAFFCSLIALALSGCGTEVDRLFEDALPASPGPTASGEAPSNAELIFSLEASLADGGSAPYAQGCAAGQLSWQDLSGNNISSTLSGFVAGDCSGALADGWRGSGTAADPYRLHFDGVNDFVDVGDISADLSVGLTIEVWARPTAATSWARFFDFGLGQQNENILFARAGVTDTLSFYTHRGAVQTNVNVAGQITDNVWKHYAATTSPISGTNNAVATLYVNGAAVGTGTVGNFVNVVRTSNFVGRSNWAADAYYEGDIAVIKIYKGARTASEMRANCQADQAKFGVTCS